MIHGCRGIGDFLAQNIEMQAHHASDRQASQRSDESLDTYRFGIVTGYGAIANGTFGHAWYQALDVAARRWYVPGSKEFVIAKVVADSLIYGPLHVMGFFAVITLGEGGTWMDVKKKIQADFWPTFGTELSVWPAVQAVNFWKVPLQYQLLVVNFVTVLDATFMSWIQHHPHFWSELLGR